MTSLPQFIRFLLVGLFSAFINFTTFYFAWQILVIKYQYAASFAYLMSVIVHFLGNRYLTFQSSGKTIKQIKRYLLLLLINYGITITIISLIVSCLRLSPYLGITLAICITVGVGFLISKQYVFKAG